MRNSADRSAGSFWIALALGLVPGAGGCASESLRDASAVRPTAPAEPPADRIGSAADAIAFAALLESRVHPEWSAVHYGYTIRLTTDQRGWFVVVTMLSGGPGHDLRGYVVRRDGSGRVVPVRSGECLIAASEPR